MNVVRNTLGLLLLVGNVIVGLGYLLCAFSPYLSPVAHPILALSGLCIPIFILANFFFLVFWLIVKWKFALLPFLFFLIGWEALDTYVPFNLGTVEKKNGKTLKVLTYNVQGMLSQVDESGKKVVPALDYILQSGADIVCLQEFPTMDTNLIKRLKKVYPYFEYSRTFMNVGIACFSKYKIVSSEPIQMVSAGNGSVYFRVKLADGTIPLIVNHLESNKLNDQDKYMYKEILKDPKNKKVKSDSKHLVHKLADAVVIRAPQADIVAKKIHSLDNQNIIVCGDFNDTPISYAHRIIAEGLQDAFVEAGNGPGITYYRNFLFFRIDHMMVGKAYRVLQCKVDRSIDASDHYPVWCLLER